jgi:hypothetical protein
MDRMTGNHVLAACERIAAETARTCEPRTRVISGAQPVGKLSGDAIVRACEKLAEMVRPAGHEPTR